VAITVLADLALLPVMIAYLVLVSLALREKREQSQASRSAARQSVAADAPPQAMEPRR
jgi:hypothetical protein